MAREGPACTPSPVGKAWGGAGGQRAAERSRRLCDLDEFLTPHLVLSFRLCAMGVTMPTTSAYPFAGIGGGGGADSVWRTVRDDSGRRDPRFLHFVLTSFVLLYIGIVRGKAARLPWSRCALL